MAGGLPLGWGAALGRSTPILDSCPPSGYAVGNHSCTPTVGPLAYLADYEVRAISYPQRPSGGLSFPLRREPNASGMGVSGRGRLGSARSLHSRAASTATNSADLAAQRSWAEPLVIFVVSYPCRGIALRFPATPSVPTCVSGPCLRTLAKPYGYREPNCLHLRQPRWS